MRPPHAMFAHSFCCSVIALALVSALPRTGAAQSASDASAPSPAEIARRARVVAHAGSTDLTVGDVEDLLAQAPEFIRRTYVPIERRREFVENVVQTILLAEEAHRRGVDREPEVASNVRSILARRLEDVDVIRAITPDQVTDAEIAAFYEAHLSDFVQPEYRRASVVVLPDRITADQVATQLRAARGDLRRVQALARERSVDDASKAHDGDLYYFRRNGQRTGDTTVDTAVAEAAFGLARELEIAGPVATTDHRFALVVLTGIRPPLSRPVTDAGVRNSIRGYVVRQRRSARHDEILARLRTQLAPEMHPERLSTIYLPPANLGNVPPFDPADRAPRRPPTPGASPVPSGVVRP